MGKRRVQIQLDVQQLTLLILGTTLFSGGLFAAGFVLGRDRRPPPFELRAPVLEPQPELTKRALPLGEVEFLFPAAVEQPKPRKAPAREAKAEEPAKAPTKLAKAKPSKEHAAPKAKKREAPKAKKRAVAKREAPKAKKREPVLTGSAKERARIQRRLAEIRALKRAKALERASNAPKPRSPVIEDEDAPPA